MTITTDKVLGLDISTKTGWVVLDSVGGLCGYGTLYHHATSGMQRVDKFSEDAHHLLMDYRPKAVFLEGYAYANSHTLVTLVEIGTVIRYKIHQWGLPICEVPPSQLKKFVCGKGSSSKDQVVKDVYKRWGFEGTNDECDAYALARFGLSVLNCEPPPTKAAGEVVSSWMEEHMKLVALL
ncbi:MAG: crossover junction endodeoxyribonuclease RuvC [bacterium]